MAKLRPSAWLFSFLLALEFSNVYSSKLVKKEAGEFEKILEQQVKTFPPEAFVADPIFAQKVDRTNRQSHYKFPNEDVVIFDRNQDDSNKEVVVLTKDEDKIPFKKSKKAYIVLKKHTTKAGIYYAESVFLRDATAADKNAVSIDGGQKVVEWVVFDEHLVPGRMSITQVALSCVSSILVPCLFNQTALSPPENFPKAPKFVPKVSQKNDIEEAEKLSFKTEDGSDPEENYDFYRDLEVSLVQGRGMLDVVVGATLGTVTGMVGGALCVMATLGCKIGAALGDGVQELQTKLQDVGLGRKKRDVVPVEQAPDYPGWKTQYIKVTKGSTLAHEDAKFFGLGNCPYKPVKDADLSSASEYDAVLFYLTVLRAECIEAMHPLIFLSVSKGLLKIQPDKSFVVQAAHKFTNQPKLSFTELASIATAAEFEAFTTFYSANIAKPNPVKITTPGGKKKVSRSIDALVKVGLKYLALVREKIRPHMIYLTRSLLQSTNSMLQKLSQDLQNLEGCSDCQTDKEINLNDRVYIMALNQFIKKGMGPVEKGSVNVETAFDHFYAANEDKFEKFVNVYT